MANTKFVVLNLYNAIVVISLLIYFPTVFLNLVFTFDDLPVANIPYYSESITTAKSDRYQYEWFFYALDVLRIIPPIFLNFQISSNIVHGKSSMLAYYVVMGVCLIVEFANFLKRSIDWGLCSSTQLCRGYETSPATANYVFLVAFWYNAAWVLFDMIYLVCGTWLDGIRVYQTVKKEEKEN